MNRLPTFVVDTDDEVPSIIDNFNSSDGGSTMTPTGTSRGEDQSLEQQSREEQGVTDHHTIVDMSLRQARFLIAVAVLLVAAFSYAIVTTKRLDPGGRYTADTVKDAITAQNALLGTVMFTVGKVFEIYAETLIFPTLHTYLHNCSLYPGDEPQRVSSPIKSGAIFWGLKTIIIFLNVSFASLFVGQGIDTAIEPSAARNLLVSSASSHRQLASMAVNDAVNQGGDAWRSFLTSETPSFPWGASTCPTTSSDPSDGLVAADVDYTSLEVTIPRHEWSERTVTHFADAAQSAPADISLSECLALGEDTCWATLTNSGASLEVATKLVQQGTAVWMQRSDTGNGVVADEHWDARAATLSSSHSPSNESIVGALSTLAQALDHHLPRVVPGDIAVHVQASRYTSELSFTSVTLRVPQSHANENDGDDGIRCGTTSCVLAVDAGQDPEIAVVPFAGEESDEQEDTAVFVFAQSRSAVKEPLSGAIREIMTLSFAKLTWTASAEENDDTAEGIQLGQLRSLALGDDDNIVVRDSDLRARARQSSKLVTLHNVLLPTARPGAVSTWLPVRGAVVERKVPGSCQPLVDEFVAHIHDIAAVFCDKESERLATNMMTAAMLHLVQDGWLENSSQQYSLGPSLFSPRLLAEMDSPGDGDIKNVEIKITIGIPASSAIATFAGCAALIVLTIVVIWVPMARVRLNPTTTPAAQYVQILTDDLYPDIVHKKRLRFANGDTLPFNEYVVDAITLHAKRDESKKIYL